MSRQHEHEFEAAPGLPEKLPAGEHILWQVAASVCAKARRAARCGAIRLAACAPTGWRSVSPGEHCREGLRRSTCYIHIA